MDGKQLLIPLRYNLECTIHAPGADDNWAVLGIALPGGRTSRTLPV
ncbi:hypothetical protein T02_8957 [Trichinella nativa]|uniref:Uncharacterized protein n=1 Tax=Trichinella nativa TaxID=6335 RepID=A0A0V1KSQ1_9BILA|nr:hypothetical protein T02_8957 [Trichinella nativa]